MNPDYSGEDEYGNQIMEAIEMTVDKVSSRVRLCFVVIVLGMLLVTLLSDTAWWLASSAFGSLLVLNLQFLIFPITAERHGLNRLSMALVFTLLLVANLKFLLVSAISFH